jgi:hypothetical protein
LIKQGLSHSRVNSAVLDLTLRIAEISIEREAPYMDTSEPGDELLGSDILGLACIQKIPQPA